MPFQSTPARGGRRAGPLSSQRFNPCFNPRPRAAGDTLAADIWDRMQCFNPRPRAAGDRPSRVIS